MRLKATCAALAAAAAFAAAAGSASAQDIAYSVAAQTDYVFRGFSQTAEDPAIQGSIDYTNDIFYAGVWASNVDFGDSTDAEVDLYGGVRKEVSGFAFDVGVVGYLYVDAPELAGGDYNYVELKGAVSRAVGPVTAGAAIYYSPDFFGIDDEATYVEGNIAFTPIDKVTVTAAIGKQYLNVTDDYNTWNAGVTYAITDNLVADVRYHETDVEGVSIASDRVVGTLKVLF